MKSFILYIGAAVLLAVFVIFFFGIYISKSLPEKASFPASFSLASTSSPIAASHVSSSIAASVAAQTLLQSLVIEPKSVIQGEPFLITIGGVASKSLVKKVTLTGPVGASTGTGATTVTLPLFIFESKVRALGAADLHQKSGTYQVIATLNNGTVLHQKMVIAIRPQVVTAFTIPSTLGGETATSEAALVSSLAAESALLKNLPTTPQQLWTQPFIFPVADPVVTDVYGYARQTGAYSVAHKGTDFRAPIGTPVYAANDGIVRLVQDFRDYGNTIVIDHGQGLMTLYMHLSKSNVAVGDRVKRGDEIALSGATGDALGPHLHLSVWIGKISIDPMKFMALMR